MAIGFFSLKMGREPGLPSHFSNPCRAVAIRYDVAPQRCVDILRAAKLEKKVVVTKFFAYFFRKKVTTTMATAIIIIIAIILNILKRVVKHEGEIASSRRELET